MVEKTFDDNDEAVKYVIKRKAGRSIIERQPIFSPDGENLVVIVENIARVYSLHTGDCVRTLESDSAINELIGIEFTDDDYYNMYGCSDDGLVITWTYENGAVLRETKLQLPDNLRIVSFNMVDSNECFVTAADSFSEFIHSGTYSVKNSHLLYDYSNTGIRYFEMIRVAIGICNGDKYAAITNGTYVLNIQNLRQPHLKSEINNHNQFRILSVAAHQKDSAVAITDTFGRITIIRGNLYNRNSIAREVLHWHFLPLPAVCFSKQGNYIISGGMEKVLVKWTLAHLASRANEKMFIPRIPSLIRYVTANNSHIAVTLSNNSIVVANAQMHVVGTILECGGLSPINRALGCSLVYHSGMSALVMPGRTGHLQLYSTTTDKVLYNVDITQMNDIPPERFNLLPLETEVICSAMSADGYWLVTSEYRNDGINYPEEKLKFWAARRSANYPFRLNTCVNLSHGGCKVVSLAINNKGEFCVSAGSDQKFRIWKRENVSQQQYKTKVAWSCLTACYYSSGIAHFLSSPDLNLIKSGKSKNFDIKLDYLPYLREVDEKEGDIILKIFNMHKESLEDKNVISRYTDVADEHAMGGVAISQDGSLIAAWFGSKLTLWDSHLCNLRTTLSHPALRPKGINVQFGNNDAAHYLVCTSENCVAVWSLLSLTLKWLVQLKTTCLVADPFSNKMAVTSYNNDVYIFSPQSSKPLMTHKCVLSPNTGVVKQCVFGSSSGDDVRLYLMRNDSEIYCLEREQSERGRLEVLRQQAPAATSQFGALVAEQTRSSVRAPQSAHAHTQPHSPTSAVAQFLSAAPHMMPPVSVLCSLFLQQISGSQEPEEVEDITEEVEEMQVDRESSDDEDVPKVELVPKAQLWTPSYDHVKEKRLKKILKEPLLDFDTTSTLFGL